MLRAASGASQRFASQKITRSKAPSPSLPESLDLPETELCACTKAANGVFIDGCDDRHSHLRTCHLGHRPSSSKRVDWTRGHARCLMVGRCTRTWLLSHHLRASRSSATAFMRMGSQTVGQGCLSNRPVSRSLSRLSDGPGRPIPTAWKPRRAARQRATSRSF